MINRIRQFINECNNAIDEEYELYNKGKEIYDLRKKEIEKLGYKLEQVMSGTKPAKTKKRYITLEVEEDIYAYLTQSKVNGISIRGLK